MVGISIAGVLLLVILALGLALLAPRFSRRREEVDGLSRQHQIGAYEGDRQDLRDNGALFQPKIEKG